MTVLHPALALFATAAVVGFTRGRLRQAVLVAGTLVALGFVLQASSGDTWRYQLGGLGLQPFRVDTLSHLFGLIFSLITVVGVIYALHVQRATEHAATLVYAGGSLGVVYAGDWLTAFAFWEVMGIASLLVIWHGETPRTRAAGFRYLWVHIAGGSLFFAGVLMHLAEGGDLTFGPVGAADAPRTVGYWLILTGVAVNAAIPPLHAWLTDAYPEASVTGAVFLSAYTTKTAVFVLVRAFPGSEVLVWAGVVMALYGVVYAVLENDIRRLLGYHIISQVGYMVAGVGMGTALAVDGSAAHAFCHILYKALLLMGAGAVIQATGRRTLTDLGGIWRQMPVVVLLYTVGAFSISGVPLFNGFISKSMIVTAAADAGRSPVELLLTLASIGTFLSTGLKLLYFTFLGPDRGLEVRPIPGNMIAAMVVAAVACTALGLAPGWLYALLPNGGEGYHPYTVDHVVGSLQLLLGTAVGFWILLKKLDGQRTISLDTDWFYRRPFPVVFEATIRGAALSGALLQATGRRWLDDVRPFAANPLLLLPRNGLSTAENRATLPPADVETMRRYDENTHRLPIGVTIFWALAGLTVIVLVVW